MKLPLTLIAMIWMGCGIDTAAPGPGVSGSTGGGGSGSGTDPSNPADPGDGTGPITQVSGHITTSTTWTGTIHVTASTTIDAGATVTVVNGTTVDVNAGVAITVSGVLAIQGTKASKVTFRSSSPDEFWSDLIVPAGGAMTANYLVAVGGGLDISSTGKVTLVDSHLSHALGDLLVMSGGTLDMTYSEIGLAAGKDTTHCNMHVTGAPAITATHSNISAAAYGFMFYGGSNAKFQYTNWLGNTIDVDTQPGSPVTGDFSHGYFAHTPATYAGFTMQNMATSIVLDAGVR
ncbi:MAG TPA: hypothetical protein VF469_20850 [Kofleriaceae bacterium]